MPGLPTGTVTYLFTDLEGNTQLWEQHPEAMRIALARHDAILREKIEANHGYVVKTTGDGFHAAFQQATDAVCAALQAQRALHAEVWPATTPLRARIALHTGAAELRDGDYYGPALNRAARLVAAGHGGQVLLSQTTYDLVRSDLPPHLPVRDLGEHRLKDLARPERVYQVSPPDLRAEFPPLRTLDNRPNNLPLQLTSFVGREPEMAEVKRLLGQSLSSCRLITLTGPGGCGKTRLALQAAADLLDEFEDGVFFVSLAAVSDPKLVASAIAQALDVGEFGGRRANEGLKEYLRQKSLLLILDNFEQVVAAATLAVELLSACPRLKVLVTSRSALHGSGEQEFPLPSLTLPRSEDLADAETLAQVAAVSLFLQRARSVKPDFQLTSGNSRAVAEICTRLDGLPLAIELAAARIKLLSPSAMLPRLERRLQLLTGGPRDLPARQQTLRGTIEWSYSLLGLGEQRLFRQLSVFAGGFTLESAERVSGEDADTLEGVASLVDKSLLRQVEQPDGEPRFIMLETIREYGLEQLRASGEEEATRRRHAEFFLALSEQAEPQLKGREHEVWLTRLDAEHDNLRGALRWLLDHEGATMALRIVAALSRFWYIRGYLTDGRRWCEEALAATASIQSPVRAKVLTGAGVLAHYQGDYGRAGALCSESLALSHRLGDKRERAAALNGLALVARSGGNYTAARAMYEESVSIFREIGDHWGLADTLVYLGISVWLERDYASARRLTEEALPIARALGDRLVIGNGVFVLAQVSAAAGDFVRARSLFEEAVMLNRATGNRRGLTRTLYGLGDVAVAQGDYAAARVHYEESLRLLREQGDRYYIAWCLEGLATLAVAQGQMVWAARLLGAAEALFEAIGASRPPTRRVSFERSVAAIRKALDDSELAMAWAVGRAMTLDEVVLPPDPTGHPANGSGQPDPAPETAPDRSPPGGHLPGGLTTREVEVLRLVAMGLTDAQVADELIVSPRTVNSHLRSIYAKLGVTSRSAATRFAIENRLT